MKNINSTDKNTQTTQSNLSENVLQRHLYSFQAHDLEGIMADFTKESILITPDKTYIGPEEIRGFFANLILHFPKQKSIFELDKIVIKEELVYIIWHAKTPSLEIPFATDTFIMKNDKIQKQTFAGQLRFIG